MMLRERIVVGLVCLILGLTSSFSLSWVGNQEIAGERKRERRDAVGERERERKRKSNTHTWFILLLHLLSLGFHSWFILVPQFVSPFS